MRCCECGESAPDYAERAAATFTALAEATGRRGGGMVWVCEKCASGWEEEGTPPENGEP